MGFYDLDFIKEYNWTRWIQQITSVLEYVEKMRFSHNALHTSNWLPDSKFYLNLTGFGRVASIRHPLEGNLLSRAKSNNS